MTPYTTPITSNDTYTVDAKFVGSDYILYCSGTFGGASVTYGYVNASDAFTAFKKDDGTPIVATSADGYFVVCPPSKQFAVTVSGATGTTSIRLDLAHRKG